MFQHTRIDPATQKVQEGQYVRTIRLQADPETMVGRQAGYIDAVGMLPAQRGQGDVSTETDLRMGKTSNLREIQRNDYEGTDVANHGYMATGELIGARDDVPDVSLWRSGKVNELRPMIERQRAFEFVSDADMETGEHGQKMFAEAMLDITSTMRNSRLELRNAYEEIAYGRKI